MPTVWQSLCLVGSNGNAIRGFDAKTMQNDGKRTKLNLKVHRLLQHHDTFEVHRLLQHHDTFEVHRLLQHHDTFEVHRLLQHHDTFEVHRLLKQRLKGTLLCFKDHARLCLHRLYHLLD